MNTPEQDLWGAVLVQALVDIGGGNLSDRQSAVTWFFTDGLPHEMGGLAWICEALDLDLGHVRKIAKLVYHGRFDVLVCRTRLESL